MACKLSLRLWMLTTKNKFNLIIFFNFNLKPTVLNKVIECNFKYLSQGICLVF